MATVSKETSVKPVTVNREVTEYVLTLSEEEAGVLQFVLHHIGGAPRTTARGITAGISDALYNAGVPWRNSDLRVEASHQDIYFAEPGDKNAVR